MPQRLPIALQTLAFMLLATCAFTWLNRELIKVNLTGTSLKVETMRVNGEPVMLLSSSHGATMWHVRNGRPETVPFPPGGWSPTGKVDIR